MQNNANYNENSNMNKEAEKTNTLRVSLISFCCFFFFYCIYIIQSYFCS